MESRNAETCANIIICLIHQTNYLLDQQLKALETDFLEQGGCTEAAGKTAKLDDWKANVLT